MGWTVTPPSDAVLWTHVLRGTLPCTAFALCPSTSDPSCQEKRRAGRTPVVSLELGFQSAPCALCSSCVISSSSLQLHGWRRRAVLIGCACSASWTLRLRSANLAS
eukprot:3351598-Pleurochrysis_carterae.AAC.1